MVKNVRMLVFVHLVEGSYYFEYQNASFLDVSGWVHDASLHGCTNTLESNAKKMLVKSLISIASRRDGGSMFPKKSVLPNSALIRTV